MQDIDVQGYSTLHCIRERGVKVTMATHVDHIPLGSMQTSSLQHTTLSTPWESFDVNVKDFQGHSVVVKVVPTWDVARVKQEISRHTHVPPRNFKLAFAGQTLAETLTLRVGWWV